MNRTDKIREENKKISKLINKFFAEIKQTKKKIKQDNIKQSDKNNN